METVSVLCCAAGKSGGHIISNLNWALKRRTTEKLLFFSGDTPLDQRIIGNHAAINWHIPLHIPSSHRWYQIPIGAFSLLISTIQSFYYLLRHRPSVILSTGGIISVPVCTAGWVLRIPIELFELNATPGMATRWISPLARTIHVCFKKTKSHFPETKCIESEYPIGLSLKMPEREVFDDSDRFTIFVQGGSQGSQFLNKKIKELVEEKKEIHNKIQIIHQTGPTDFNWTQFYATYGIPSVVFDFQDDIAPYYAHANLVICRSGAGQLFETLYFKKPCITIPLEIPGNSHQLENARAILEQYPDHFVLIRQPELNSGLLADAIEKLKPKSQSRQDQSDQPSAQTSH